MSDSRTAVVTVTDEQQIAVLRELIRRAGADTGLRRWLWFVVPCLPVIGIDLLLCAWALASNEYGDSWWHLLPTVGTSTLIFLTVILAAGALIAVPAGVLIRRSHRRRLHDALAELPQGARSSLLLSLLDDRAGDTRKIARGLARDFSTPAEMVDAGAFIAHGDGTSPTGLSTASSHNLIGLLQEEIRRAGIHCEYNAGYLAICIFLLLYLTWSALLAGPDPKRAVVLHFAAPPCAVLFLGVLLHRFVRRRQRRDQSRRLQDLLMHLPVTTRTEVIRPLLRDSSSDTHHIAASLARTLGLSTEIAPAPAPAARGDEASPAAGPR
jgi:hypothetical protein